VTTTLVFIYTLVAKTEQIAEQSDVNGNLVSNKHSSKTVPRYNMHTMQKKTET